ncbi:hypothetical protein BDW62DRAFT_138265 [Aspergillus aurantiobrunneus]
MLKLSTAALLSSLLSLSLPAITAAQGSANCSVFNWDENEAYLENYPPQRVSGASSCPDSTSNQTCELTASGDAQYTLTYNITTLDSRYFASIVSDAVSNQSIDTPGFNATVTGSIDATRILNPGQSGYLNFTAYRFCYTGTVANCTGGLEDDTPLEVCAPVWHEDGSAVRIEGEYTVVNVSAEDVGQYEDPYENQSDGSGDEPGEGGALGLMGRMNGGLVVLVGLVAVMVV